MTYATRVDIDTLYGSRLLLTIADTDVDGVVDEALVARAIADSAGVIDSYLSVRYDLPLATVPDFLRRICVNIAVYTIAIDGDRLTDEYRRRYEDAIDHLKRIADGKAGLGLQQGEDGADTADQRGGMQPGIWYRARR